MVEVSKIYAAAAADRQPGRSTYISAADAAALLRAALKTKFPGIKFSVRKSGDSLRVEWTDGPSRSAVEAIAKPFAGEGFDGSIDLRYSYRAWLMPDGSVSQAGSEGTTGSMGYASPFAEPSPGPGAIEVRFMSSFVFCDRLMSQAAMQEAIEAYGKAHADPLAAAIEAGEVKAVAAPWGAEVHGAGQIYLDGQGWASAVLHRFAQQMAEA